MEKLIINTKIINDNINHTTNELKGEIRSKQAESNRAVKNLIEIEEQVKRTEEEKNKRNAGRERKFEKKLTEVEPRGISRYITGDIRREITYNGLDRYLMEFLNYYHQYQWIWGKIYWKVLVSGGTGNH